MQLIILLSYFKNAANDDSFHFLITLISQKVIKRKNKLSYKYIYLLFTLKKIK